MQSQLNCAIRRLTGEDSNSASYVDARKRYVLEEANSFIAASATSTRSWIKANHMHHDEQLKSAIRAELMKLTENWKSMVVLASTRSIAICMWEQEY